MIQAVGIVIPVHDEAAHLGACLVAIAGALQNVPPEIEVVVELVLDACRDDSAAIATAWASAQKRVHAIDERNVGSARGIGMLHALDALAGWDRARTWLTTTDADSTVPPMWLTEQLQLANAGADAVAGSIHVHDWSEHAAELGPRFSQFYAPDVEGDSHTHVHGANLGVRACAYLQAGGFEPLQTGEDHALWRALQRVRRVSSRRFAVTTSSRLGARAPEGFSHFLAAFAATR